MKFTLNVRFGKLIVAVLVMTTILVLNGCQGSNESKDNEADETQSASENSVQNRGNDVESFAKQEGFQLTQENLWRKELSVPELSENGATRFEIVADSGIEFTNVLKRESQLKFIETGAGVAIGDYDNDGVPDVYLLSTDGPNKLFRGLGDFKFEDVTVAAGNVDGAVDGKDVWATGGSFADIDNDGDLDLFVCNTVAQNLLYLNNGDGTFTENSKAANLDHVGASKVGSFCDYDHDGDLDLYLLTYQDFEPTEQMKVRFVDGQPTVHPDFFGQYEIMAGKSVHAGDADILYQNDGNGRFTDVSQAAGIAGYDLGLSVTWFDFDNDGWQDIYVGNDFKTPDHLYRNNHDGTFSDVIGDVVQHTPWFSMGADSGDLNNDGLIDMMIADMSGTSHYKQKTNMGDMSDASWFLTYGHPRQYMRNSLYINSGAGRFMDMAFQAGVDSTDWTWSVKFADLDNDGWQDIFVTNGHARDTNSDLSNKLKKMQSEMSKEEFAEVGFDVPALREENLAFKNSGSLDFSEVGESWGLNLMGVSHGAAFSDFDRDGDLDIVVNNLNEPATVYRNVSNQGSRLLVDLRGNDCNRFGTGATIMLRQGDCVQTKTLVSVRGYISSDEPVVHFGLPDSTKIDELTIEWPGGGTQRFVDLKPNHFYRVVENGGTKIAENHAETVPLFSESVVLGLSFNHEETPFNDYRREPLLPNQLSQLGPGVAWGDVNNDGFPDAFVGGASSQSGAMFLNRDGTEFEEIGGPWKRDIRFEDMGCLFFDADGDGDEDLYVASGSNEFERGSQYLADRLYINEGNEKFRRAEEGTLPAVLESGSCVAACDFDRDGDLDVFVGTRSIPGKYPLPATSHLLINEGGKFVAADAEIARPLLDIGLVNGSTWTDFDQDGWVDLVLALEWGPVTVLKNNEGRLQNVTADMGLAKFTGWWHGVSSGDLDNDGDIDLVVTNHGLNTKYHTDFKHPHRLYYYDFDDSGTLDLVEAEFEGDVEYPVRGRSCSSRCMPFIADKFETFHEFALAPISDIYEDDVVERPHLEVTTLDSVVLWNDQAEGFRLQKLPALTQNSPGYGVACRDFDHDGNIDILLAQNFFGAQPETGYMDGGVGWFLKANGSGEFELTWPNESGVVLPDDSMGLATADLDKDGDLDVLIAANNGKTRLLLNNTNTNEMCKIELMGPKSNRSAIGALVTTHFENGDVSSYEFNAGSSYLSQSFCNPIFVTALRFESIKKLEIRWPDGERSTHLPNGEKELTIDYGALGQR